MRIRRWLYWLLILGFIWVVASRFREIQRLLHTVTQGRWQWVLLAAGLQLVYYTIYTLLYESGFKTVGVTSRFRELLPITFASLFASTAAPTGGAAGFALFFDDARRRGESSTRSAVGVLLVVVTDYAAFCLLLIAGLIELFVFHDLQFYEIGAALLLFLLLGAITAGLTLGIWRPVWLHQVLQRIQTLVNLVGGWFLRPDLLPADWSERNAAEYTTAAQAMVAQPYQVARTLLFALLVHLTGLLSLYTVFLAFRQPATLGILVAGYAMTILFAIISPTPSGIGVVEGLMPVIYVSLGIPVAAATVITFTFRGLSFWIPTFVGFLLLRRLRTFTAPERSLAETEQPHLAAVITALMGVVNLLSGATPSLMDRVRILATYSPLEVRRGGHLTSVLAGFALLVLARGLWRRKQTAWLLTVAILCLSVIVHLVKGLDYEEAALAATLLIYLFMQRSHFRALSDDPSVWQGIRTLTGALLFTLAYGAIGFYVLDRHFRIHYSLFTALRQTVTMFTQFYDPGLEPTTGYGRFFASSIYVVGAVTLGYGLLMLLRPVLVRTPASASDRQRATRIVQTYGRSSLARFALFADKAYYFSPGGSAIAYAVKNRTALALGDPIGPAHDVENAVLGFKEFCALNDWLAAFYQTLPDYLKIYRTIGYDTLCIGHEAIVHLDAFSLTGSANKPIRNALNRVTKLGYQALLHEPPLPDTLLNELRNVSDEWLNMMQSSEKRFSLGWFEDNYVRNAPVMAIHAPDGGIVAFANIVTEYQRNEVTIDLMRRRRDLENGIMDFLFVSFFLWAKERGYATFNLGLSALSGVGERPNDPAVERGLRYIYEHVNQFYNFKGLHEFKEKFHPEWSPRYLIYPGPASLLGAGMTLQWASSGDDFFEEYIVGSLKKRFAQNGTKPPIQEEEKIPASEQAPIKQEEQG
ncbi:MAG: flippase-like domain-containing protein [Caldilineaceae bacterium]